MALLTGPLFSLDASGTIGKTVTYSRWKGRSYARRRVIPVNPFSADQVAARNMMRVAAAGQAWANASTLVKSGKSGADKVRIAAITPDGQAWNGFLVANEIGDDAVTYTAGAAVYDALQAGEKTAWVNAAAALTPPILDCAQAATGGGPGTALSKGKVFFLYEYALYAMGLDTVPTATPPTYA